MTQPPSPHDPATSAAIAARLARLARVSTCRLTHHGRKSGRKYTVTIWFLVEGDTVYFASARRTRSWVRNLRVQPLCEFTIDGEVFAGSATALTSADEQRHVMDLTIEKYWYLRPFVGLARLVGRDPTPDASFRVQIE